jgi:hypothetical protein
MSADHLPGLLFREQWLGQHLEQDHPPRFSHPHKALLYELAGGAAAASNNLLTVSRWRQAPEPRACWTNSLQLECRDGYFQYDAPSLVTRSDWYLNFADVDLFGFYAGPLFAQDELQVAEHPTLISLRSMLKERGRADERYVPRTRDASGMPTPVLVSGVERRIAVDTTANARAGRPHGLYGNWFGRASAADIKGATRHLLPASVSQILAVEAPKGGGGQYTRAQIGDALLSALTGFAAVKTQAEAAQTLVVHSGNWGCGAFGGNLVLMYTVQMLAAQWANIDQLVLYAVSPDAYSQAQAHYAQLCQHTPTIDGALDYLLNQQFAWGVSNGT